MKRLIPILLALLLLVSCGGKLDLTEGLSPVDAALQNAIFEFNEGKYLEGECKGAGIVLVGQEEKDENTVYYTITMYGEYEMRDNAMCKISGSGAIPAVITLNKDNELVEYKEPVDGEGYFDMVREMFPQEYHERVLSLSIEDYTELTREEADCITKYLKANDLEVVIKQ